MEFFLSHLYLPLTSPHANHEHFVQLLALGVLYETALTTASNRAASDTSTHQVWRVGRGFFETTDVRVF